MTKQLLFFLVMVISCLSLNCAAADNTANNEALYHDKLNSMHAKPYHQTLEAMGKDNSCQLCHGTKTPVSSPNDSNCLNCHGSRDQVAALTLPDPKDKNAEPNPHNSIHYGKDASCTMCHNEHKPSEIYCNNCHLFKYPNMKP
ncbi:flavocytochrome c heme subunit [Hafnia paralvei ATCC 29927]|nr:cytochrome c3 family protein [Hafnia paralvei]EFV40789.1 hypothetical protein HMPREF0864_01898 [Enterobacteriaceae bacterium 9_2_54FAA]MDU1193384.1 cytochrome c3 family protein [Enterobacteriaceae bacterium]MCE9903669.1 cytochrome c3 family protein [Hafnia paralvei]MCE9914061.1 cytochrome c3 family protein [Hafnia paralvei]MCE9920359.1 cytochrome c3 family protein [Hafnia paralvei]